MGSETTPSLDDITGALIRRLIQLDPSISEGVVRTPGPPPYRRLDCRKRALLYLRTRTKKRLVRLDITGLWLVPPRCRLSINSSAGCALVLRSELDVDDAVQFVLQTVARTQLSLPKARPSRSSSPKELAAR
jgi:hypothetical protein